MGYVNDDPCLVKAFDDEKIFVLLARDPTAPLVILEWIKINIGKQPYDKLKEAYECAMEMMLAQKEMYTRSHPDPKQAVLFEECDQCDGVGTVEGGKYIETTCSTCGGSGKVPKKEPEQKVVEAVNKLFIDGEFDPGSYEARIQKTKKARKKLRDRDRDQPLAQPLKTRTKLSRLGTLKLSADTI
jgi:hypothetical protein